MDWCQCVMVFNSNGTTSTDESSVIDSFCNVWLQLYAGNDNVTNGLPDCSVSGYELIII